MLPNGNIDLMHEKKELEAFLSICLEKADLILGPEVQEPEEKAGIPAPEPERAGPDGEQRFYPEPVAPEWERREETPAAGEAAARGAGPSSLGEPPAEELQEPVSESEPEPRVLETVR